MIDQDRLIEFADSYLKSLISEASGSVGRDFDSFAPFGELGIDSFRVLKIVKALETDFGTLPKTLLFENFNVNDLARYFVDKHAETLSAKFANEGGAAPVHAAATPARPSAAATTQPVAVQAQAPAKPISAEPRSAGLRPAEPRPAEPLPAGPILILEKDAYAHPELGKLIKDIFDRYKNDGSVSRGTRNIAPNLFIGSERKGYFHYSRSKNIIVAYTYTGPTEYFSVVAQELCQHCDRHGFELNLLAADELTAVGDVAVSSTPFGVLQRILDLQHFKLDGQAMRRLRYLVSKFEKSGNCRTEEFRCGSNPETSQDIARVIDLWCAARTMVNPLIHIVKDEILAGTLNPEHRIFLTYLDDVLQNVILISQMSAELNGYLMDLEFYHKDMPLGGLEFTIVNIVRTLVAEGCDMLSLGGTYGCKLHSSSNADPEVDKILDELRMQNIFNDEGNLQFKNKFRPESQTIYLCRPIGKCNPHNVIDIIMMIADPMKMQTSDEQNHNFGKPGAQGVFPPQEGEASKAADSSRANGIQQAADPIVGLEGENRSFVLSECGFNPLNVPHEQVEFDMKTDSWAQLHMPAIDNQIRHLHAQLQQPANLEKTLQEIFPFTHFALTTSGRTAEGVFYKAWPRKGVVLQNMLFPTTIFHQIDKGFTPKELPHPEVFKLDSKEPYKGDLDWAALQQQLERDAAGVSAVCIEVSNNAAGGCPVSIEHLKKVKALLGKYAIPLIIDGTRILENARFLINNEKEYAGQSVWQVARALLSHADAVVVSLAKDFCVPGGGLIATNDAALYRTLQRVILEEGCALGAIDKKLLALSLQDRKYLEAQSLRRLDAVNRIWTTLEKQGIPVVQPAGGHCVLIDVKQIPEFKDLRNPVASFVAWLYLSAGIRAGAHNAGMQQATAINGLVRLAVPIGLKPQQVDEIAKRISAAFADKRNIPEIDMAEGATEAFGDIYAKYKLLKYHNSSGSLVAKASVPAATATPPNAAATQIAADPPSIRHAGASPRDIAIVGMAGRYPKAKDLADLWENLVQGADCIEDIPEARLAQRLHNDFTKRYRGGFIDDVERFDAKFFGISARDAQIMDPQERVFLEVAYEAVEDAGYYPEILGRDDATRDIGVFVGAVWSSYQMLGVEEKVAGNNINPSSFLWSIANRVSHWMNLSGSSLTVDTACSASLTAVKLACDAINNGECSAAIVGGVNLDLHQSKFDINSTGGSLSKDGVCRSYGKGANGYVSGEGAGALFLKPLAQAVADGDHIYGVIKSAVVTHSGRTSAYTVPNPRTQTTLISKALEQGKIDPRTIGYLEGHGTGTDFGDSIEIAGLANAFEKYKVDKQSCALGSIKTNIGHLEAASGIVGLQKILLQMKHRKLVPSLHSSELNGNIDFKNSPFHVQQEVEEWGAKEVDGIRFPRRAGISTIGIGGVNAHIILEEYEPAARSPVNAEAGVVDRIFPLSAKSEEQLQEAAVRLRDFLKEGLSAGASGAQPNENDIAYTLLFGRKSFDYRLAVVAKTTAELAEKLTAFVEGRADPEVMVGHVKNANAVTALLNAREKQDFVNLLIQSRDPRRLARIWSDGVIADWQGLDIGQHGRRTPLPTYPFAKERYWIVDRQPALLASSAILLEAKPAPPVRDDARGGTARWTEKYQFSMAMDHDGAADRGLILSIDEKAGLFVRQMFADQLKLSVDDVSRDAHLMETGVTSMDMAEMTQALKERLDPAFSPTAFFECMTLGSFADLLAQKYEAVFQKMIATKVIVEASNAVEKAKKKEVSQDGNGNGSHKPLHLQDAQADLPLPDLKSIQPVYQGKARTVLLTGATGFLGIHALSGFLGADPEVRVLCLVRAPDKEQGMQRIRQQAQKYEQAFDETRIAALCGDINEPRLGLSEDEWERCCREVDQILHASAHVNHVEGYATFRESTQGMKEVIRLAGSHRLKLIQFISSTATCFHKIGEEFSIFENEAFCENGEFVYGGYGQSKWVQETYLKRVHEYGIPYVIYRFGELSGSSQTGLGQIDDMLHRLLQMRLAIGCREKISNDVLDMLPVDVAAKLIVGTGNKPALWNNIIHATHLRPYSFANLYRRAQSSGLQFAPVTREQFLSKCGDFVKYIYSVNPVNGFVLECVLRDVEGSVRKRKVIDGYFAVLFPFAQDNFKRSLQALGFTLPEWTSVLDRYFSRWSDDDCGFMATIYDYQKWSQLEEEPKLALMVTPKDKAVPTKTKQEDSMLENVNEA